MHRTPVKILVFLSLWFQATANRDELSKSRSNRPSLPQHLRILRGGRSYNHQSGTIELNPQYENYQNEHQEWLREQEKYQQQQQRQYEISQQQQWQQPPSVRSSRFQSNTSVVKIIQNYFIALNQLSPSLVWTNALCLAIFAAWQIPALTRNHRKSILLKWFVNSRVNVRKSKGLCLILSALSHKDLLHILANLMTLRHVGPQVAKLVLNQQGTRASMLRPTISNSNSNWFQKLEWNNMLSLLLSSAIVSNLIFLMGRPAGSSIGLSGVTSSLLAIYASSYPDQVLTIMLYTIPISLPARQLLNVSLAISAVGSLIVSSPISHLTHLGGLLYGMLYHHLFLRTSPANIFLY